MRKTKSLRKRRARANPEQERSAATPILVEEMRILEEKRLAEEKWVAEEKLLTKTKEQIMDPQDRSRIPNDGSQMNKNNQMEINGEENMIVITDPVTIEPKDNDNMREEILQTSPKASSDSDEEEKDGMTKKIKKKLELIIGQTKQEINMIRG